MKKTLQEKVEKMLSDLLDRQKQLKQYIEEYKLSNQFQEAQNCQIRLDTLETVRVRLFEVLS